MRAYVLFCSIMFFFGINGAQPKTPVGKTVSGLDCGKSPASSPVTQAARRTIYIPQEDRKAYDQLWELFDCYGQDGSKADVDSVSAKSQEDVVSAMERLITDQPSVLKYPYYTGLQSGSKITRRLYYPLEMIAWMVAPYGDERAERALLRTAASLEHNNHLQVSAIKYGITHYSFSCVDSVLRGGFSVELFPEIITHLIDTCEILHRKDIRKKELSNKREQLMGMSALLLAAGANCSVAANNMYRGIYDDHQLTGCLLIRTIKTSIEIQSSRTPKFKTKRLVCKTSLPPRPLTMSPPSFSSSVPCSSPSSVSPSLHSASILSPTSASSTSALLQPRRGS